MKNVVVHISLCLVALILGAPRLHGQAATASISGTVTDSSGAAVPGAALEIRNTATGATRTVASDAQGRYSVPLEFGHFPAKQRLW